MRIAHDTLVLVADGRKSLFLRNEGDDAFLNLVVEDQGAHADFKDSEMKSDAPGRMSAADGRRSSVEETDHHQLEEDRFAADTAALLAKHVEASGCEHLIVVAPPRTLGELRRHYDKGVAARIVAEVDKDLVNHPIPKLEAILKEL